MKNYLKISLLCLILLVPLCHGEVFHVLTVDDTPDNNTNYRETNLFEIWYTLNADGSVDCLLTHEFHFPIKLEEGDSIFLQDFYDIRDSEEIDASSIEIKDLYNTSLKFERTGKIYPNDVGKYTFEPKTNRINFSTLLESENGATQVKYTYKPRPWDECSNYYWEQGQVPRNVSFTLPFSTEPYKVVVKGIAGEGLIFNMSTINSSNCPDGWELRPNYPKEFECIIDAISFVNESQKLETNILLTGILETPQEQQKNKPEVSQKSPWEKLSNFFNSPIIGAIISAVLSAFLGLIIWKKYVHKTPSIEEVAKSIDDGGYKLMQQYGRLPRGIDHFELEVDPAEVKDSAKRLIELEILFFASESYEKGFEYAYRWTDLGYKVMEHLGIKKMTLEEFEKSPLYEDYKSKLKKYEEFKKRMND